nr:WSC domain-containing protein 2-like [Penaeus vannamei]
MGRFLLGGRAPLIAVASFPGSGNTWLRYVVEVLTGVFTGSVYHDEVLAIRGFWGERDGYRQGTTLLQKTHSFPLLQHEVKDGIYNGQEFRFLLPKGPRRAVLLLRNPWESLVALRHFHAAGHTGFGSGSYFKEVRGWANFTVERAEFWVKLNAAWLALPDTDLLVVHYEHLQHDLEKEAERLVNFLGLPIDYGRVECLVRYPEGRFRRPKYPKHLQGYRFPTKAAEILRTGMGHLDNLLRRGGHPSFPTHLYTFTPIVADPPLPVGGR